MNLVGLDDFLLGVVKFNPNQPRDEHGRFMTGRAKPQAIRAVLHDGMTVEGFELEGHFAYYDYVGNKRVPRVTTKYLRRS